MFFFRFSRLALHQFDGIQPIMNVFVFRALYGTVGGMRDAPKILHKAGVNAKNGMVWALGLHDIANRQRAHIAAILEVSWIQRL